MRRLLLVLALLVAGVSSASAQWITQNGITATRFPIRLIPIAQPTTTVLEGTVYYDSTAHLFKVYSGSAWVPIGNVSAANLGTTSTDGLTLQTPTLSNATTTVQISPRLKWCGTAWNSTSAASETDCMFLEVLPATAAGTTTATLKVGYINTSGTVTYPATVTSGGAAAVTSVSTSGSGVAVNGSGAYYFLNTAILAQTTAVTAGADDTTTITQDMPRWRYQATITPATAGATNCGPAFLAAALTADCTIATLPAGMKLTAVYADVTVGFTCSGTCTGTKVVQCGTAAGGTQILAASLNVAATGQFGLADADLGSGMTRAAAIQGGLIGSWTATTPVSCRFTSGTGNWGNAATTFVNAGSIKFTLITEQIK